MALSEEEFTENVSVKYLKVRQLLDNKKNDSPSEPYKSSYEARDLLDDLKAMISNRIDSLGSKSSDKEIAMLAGVYYLHGCISMEVDELSTGEEFLTKSVELLQESPSHPKFVVPLISSLNQLGLLYSVRDDIEKSHSYFKQSEKVCNNYQKHSEEPPVEFHDLMSNTTSNFDRRAETSFEQCHTLTLFFLAQVTQRLGDTITASIYSHKTLERQLEMKKYDKIDWAVNSATLSQFLVEQNAFLEARHHLAAASKIIDEMQTDLDAASTDDEHHAALVESLSHRKSDVARCWAKYCLNLLSVSIDRLMDDGSFPLRPPSELCGLDFPTLEVAEYENVSANFCLTYSDALPVFKAGQQWLNEAAIYYTLENHASDHVAVIKDQSQLYLKLAFFEDDESRQCKMHKRRVDLLTHLSDQLNVRFYIDKLRELWFENAEAYLTMADLKTSLGADNNQGVSKINHLLIQALNYYQKFIDSFMDIKSGMLPERYPVEYERCLLLAQIYRSKVLTRINDGDKGELLQRNTLAYQGYKSIVHYCDRWKTEWTEESQPLTELELSTCRDMSHLMPHKLTSLAQRIERGN